MGARSIRLALKNYIAPTAGLTNAYKDEPHYVSNDAWYTADGVHGTVAYVHIDEEEESRLVITGFPESGQEITYRVSVIVLYEYLIPDQEPSPDDWVDGLDDVLDALKARIRADPHLGTGPTGIVSSAAQHDKALSIVRDLPKKDGGVVRSWNALAFEVMEIVM